MNVSLISWIASRFLRSKSAGRFAPLLTATAIAGVAAGTMSLIVVMSVMRGFREELAARLTGFNAHITLSRGEGAEELSAEEAERLLARESVREIYPFVQGEVIAEATVGSEHSVQGARVRGIDPSRMGSFAKLDVYFTSEERLEGAFARQDTRMLPEVIVGSETAANLTIHPDFGDSVELTAPLAEIGPTGDLVPNRRSYRVSGIFSAGIYELDSKYLLVSLDEARRLLGLQAREGWQIRLADATDAPAVMARLKPLLPPGWDAQGFDEHNRKLFAALRLERVAMTAILAMVLLIASCSIAAVSMLMTASKRKDMAILRAVGMRARRVAGVFLAHSAMIGAAGSVLGLAGGVAVTLAADRWPLRLPSSYYLDSLPVDLSPGFALIFALAGVAVSMAASTYPVLRTAKLDPVEALRYE